MPGFQSLQGLAQGAGAAQGLAQGMQAFVQTRSALNEEAIKKKLANAQGAEAYSKLLQSGLFPDQANQAARSFGLLSGGGMLPGDTEAQQPSSSLSLGVDIPHGSQPNANAPSGAQKIDDSGMSPTASGEFTPQSLRAQGFNANQVRHGMEMQLDQKIKERDPKYQAELEAARQNLTLNPTEKAIGSVKDLQDQIGVEAPNYKLATEALRNPGEHSQEIAIQALRRMATPDIKRLMGEDLGQEKGFLNKLENEIAESQGKGLSEKSAANLKKAIDTVHGVMSENFRSRMSGYRKAFPQANEGAFDMGELNKADAMMKKNSPSAESGPGGARGLIKTSPAGLMPKQGLSKDDFLNWYRNRGQ